MMRVQRFGEHRAMPWANGRGTSYEIASDRDDAGEWSWRVAIAPVTEDGPFSRMPCVDRKLLLIEGSEMRLTIDGKKVSCEPGVVIAFRGEAQTEATLPRGPIVDLGLMVHRKKASGSVVFASAIDKHLNIDAELVVAVGGEARLEIDGAVVVLQHKDACLNLHGTSVVLRSGAIAAVQYVEMPT